MANPQVVAAAAAAAAAPPGGGLGGLPNGAGGLNGQLAGGGVPNGAAFPLHPPIGVHAPNNVGPPNGQPVNLPAANGVIINQNDDDDDDDDDAQRGNRPLPPPQIVHPLLPVTARFLALPACDADKKTIETAESIIQQTRITLLSHVQQSMQLAETTAKLADMRARLQTKSDSFKDLERVHKRSSEWAADRHTEQANTIDAQKGMLTEKDGMIRQLQDQIKREREDRTAEQNRWIILQSEHDRKDRESRETMEKLKNECDQLKNAMREMNVYTSRFFTRDQ